MTVSAWLKKAKKLLETFEYEISIKNGSKKMTMAQATSLNELQHEIGSHHGIKQVTYKEGAQTLVEMIAMVESGRKTPPLTAG
ncbi:hypothetical protein DBR39_15680 [Chryseobacterium sp. KBW03]|jgi:hypothetical protein|uniref:Uncharacterized protein n=1 Tax=Chryseobacterium viscerum TaxID=1037377 RepID=A0A316WJY9_9FLAO|nr:MULTISPECIES: hypothetical protein [Chryseobacterium]KAB1230414.1 hypothetical protein F8D52_11645 [Chryseobacterium viscerum]PWN61732.1 hypothetical protein C1634_010700 [Chryseobacterium viscerum]RQO38303.1 hypothetical protein DBR39_15680 [Chryseobacterium sp. KBW03]UKB80546.1 hypothetical protein LF886_06020 [Chryseobacterium sp. MEBOG07]